MGSASVVQRGLSRARPRRLQLYVVGTGKTATTSAAGMFGAYRSGHEVDALRMKRVAARARAGDLGPASARWELRRRDLRFRLEVDSAHFLTPFVPQLTDLYPRARFVVLLRDCFSWVDSLLEHWARIAIRTLDRRPELPDLSGISAIPSVVRSWVSVEGQLREGRATAGLAVALLQTWAATNTRLLTEAPAARTLGVRTEDLDEAAPRLAAFCGVDVATLRPGLRWNASPNHHGVLANVPPELMVSEAERWCAPLMEQHWGPEWRALVARIPAALGDRASPGDGP